MRIPRVICLDVLLLINTSHWSQIVALSDKYKYFIFQSKDCEPKAGKNSNRALSLECLSSV